MEATLKGYNATVLAYGQTGSGKTFTILGPSAESIVSDDVDVNIDAMHGYPNGHTNGHTNGNTNGYSYSADQSHGSSSISRGAGSQAGVIPRALRDLFNRLETTRKKHQLEHLQNSDYADNKKGEKPYEYEVRVQFLELYGEDIRDLLSNSASSKLVIRDGGGGVEPEVIGASEVKVNSAEEALLCLTRGTLRRVTGATAMNSESSRSHAIMTVIVEQTTFLMPGSSPTSGGNGNGNGSGGSVAGSSSKMGHSGSNSSGGSDQIESKRSKFHFVDLAGSERQKRSLASGQRLKEGIDINKGLLVLGNVISALGDPKKRGKSFVPYRDSKLTRLLKGSLGGNHKTLMIACVSPSSINLEESLNCLRYANRAKNIQNNAVINLDAGSKLIAGLREQVRALAGELLITQGKCGGDDSSRLFKMSLLKSLANGGNVSKMNIAIQKRQSSEGESDLIHVGDYKAEIAKLKSVAKQLKSDLATKDEELFAAKAEAEYFRLQVIGGEGEARDDDEASGEEKTAFVNRVKEYEQEIANLRKQLRNAKAKSAFQPSPTRSEADLSPTTPPGGTPPSGRNLFKTSNSGRKSRKVFKPIVVEHEDSQQEDNEITKITKKYLKLGNEKGKFVDEDEDGNDNPVDEIEESDEDEDETFLSRQSILDSHVIQLSKGIAAKQELIGKLEQSQLKYEVRIYFCPTDVPT